jgi:hypothetical protein
MPAGNKSRTKTLEQTITSIRLGLWRKAKYSLVALCATLTIAAAPVFAAPPPDTVKQAGALNTGGTSFYDGFGRQDEGFSFLEYIAYNISDRINTYNGQENPAFKNPHIESFVTLHQVAYTTDWQPFGGLFAFSAAIPTINFSTQFDTPGAALHPNSYGIGDSTWGPIWQSRPVLNDAGRAVFSYRFQLQIISPTGSFSSSRNLNQSAEYWIINPYVAFTVLPLENWEISARIHYTDNMSSSKFSSPPKIPGLIYEYGQAGNNAFANFASSYKIFDGFSLGVNGFYLKQLNDDTTNGIKVPNSKQEYLFIGPGARYELDNVYLPEIHDNISSGPRFNLMLVHRF